jgi:hypothetical protein
MESQHTLLINSNKGCQEQAWRSINHPMSHRTHRENSRFQRTFPQWSRKELG